MAEPAYEYHRSFWSRLTGSAVFASALSVGLHAAIFLAFYQMVFSEEPRTRTLIIPEARLAAPGSPMAGSPAAPNFKIDPPPSKLPAPTDALTTELQSAPTVTATADPLIAAAVLGGPGESVASTSATSISSGFGSAPVVGAGLAGAGGRGPAAPVSSFFGQAGNAYKVVYVVDVSASLMLHMEQILEELRLSIESLLPIQQFHIVLAKPRVVEEFSPRRLVPANADYKRQAAEFLRQIKRIPEPGQADPIGAMQQAFNAGPELIYFLTDGEYRLFADQLEQRLQELNTPPKLQITVIGFDPSPEARKLLEHIASQHHGNFRVVEPKP